MGSRAVALVCRDAQVAARPVRRRRTARPAPSTPAPAGRSSTPDVTEQLLDRLRVAADRPGCGTSSATDWLLLDAELLPWSAKAEELLR